MTKRKLASELEHPRKAHGLLEHRHGLKSLAAELLHLTIDQMTGPPRRNWMKNAQREATIWLATNSATPYFDLLGIEQVAALRALHWTDHARALMRQWNDGEVLLSKTELYFLARACIRLGDAP